MISANFKASYFFCSSQSNVHTKFSSFSFLFFVFPFLPSLSPSRPLRPVSVSAVLIARSRTEFASTVAKPIRPETHYRQNRPPPIHLDIGIALVSYWYRIGIIRLIKPSSKYENIISINRRPLSISMRTLSASSFGLLSPFLSSKRLLHFNRTVFMQIAFRPNSIHLTLCGGKIRSI